MIFSKYQVTDTKWRPSTENRYRVTKKVSQDAKLYAYALNLYEKDFAWLFKDEVFQKVRIGVPYLAVQYDTDTKAVRMDRLVFC